MKILETLKKLDGDDLIVIAFLIIAGIHEYLNYPSATYWLLTGIFIQVALIRRTI